MINLNPLFNCALAFSIETEWLLLFLLFLLILKDGSILSYTLACPFELKSSLVECAQGLADFIAREVLRITNILLNKLNLLQKIAASCSLALLPSVIVTLSAVGEGPGIDGLHLEGLHLVIWLAALVAVALQSLSLSLHRQGLLVHVVSIWTQKALVDLLLLVER